MRLVCLSLFLAACGGSKPPPVPAPAPEPAPEAPAPAPAVAHSLKVPSVPLTADLAEATEPRAASTATVDGAEVPIGYHVLRRVGDDGFGAVIGRDGEALDSCNDQDFNALLEAHGKPWLISHFECTPGAVAISALEQADDGTLTAGAFTTVDWTDLGGLWFPCAGQVSPWGTHVGSEEYEPNARWHQPDGTFDPDPWDAWARMSRWWDDPKAANPYLYGWIPEITIVDAEGTTSAVKHLSPGRFSHEIAYVLPDRRTVYLSDDGGATGWFLFVADEPGDLSAGALYAARLTQTSGAEGGRFDVSWVPLGHASDADIQPLIDAGVTFDDLFVATEPAEDGSCPEGTTWTWHSFGQECLKLAEPSEAVPDPAVAASRLETRRYAAMKGASTELNKGEGVSFDPVTGTVFVVMSKLGGRMLAEPDVPTDHVKVPKNSCGGVYAGDTAAGVTDSTGAAIDSEHVTTNLYAYVLGRPLDAPDADGNTCSVDGIANPDNITFLPHYGVLAIGEDTKAHRNAVLWFHDAATDALSRVVVAPPGGEMTGLHWIPDLGGHGYLTLAVQHPWGELGKGAAVPEAVTDAHKRSFTGVVGPFPALTATD